MNDDAMIQWLLQGDVAIQYQTHRDLLGEIKPDLQRRIEKEGWGQAFLSRRNTNGHWGRGYYQPKWTSTHYTLLDLKNLAISPDQPLIRQTIEMLLMEEKSLDGGIDPRHGKDPSDACLNGMFLNYASYFRADEDQLKTIVDFILLQQLPDGGFNCHYNCKGAVHSSLHTTLSVAEGILEYRRNGYSYRVAELYKAELECREFMLQHRLYLSDKTGAVIKQAFTRLSYPGWWHYDILKALDYFFQTDEPYENRMENALHLILKKRKKDGFWYLQARHPGQIHFEMEKNGGPSRWNTLRAMRVLNKFQISI